MTVAVLLQIVQLGVTYGIPAVTSAINALGKTTITDADIADLTNLVKPPESY